MLWQHRGLRLHYDLLGPSEGSVVCLLHSLAADGGMWAEQVQPLLQAGFRVLRPDLRGHGGSEASAGPVTLLDLAEDVAALLDMLELGPVHLVGLSLGGMVAQALALEQPHLLRSLTLCDTLAVAPPIPASTWAARIEAAKAAGSLEPLADETLARWLSPGFRAMQPSRSAAIRATIVATSPAGYANGVSALSAFDFRPRLRTLRLPTLLIYGAEDPSTPAEAGAEMAALIPGSRFEALAGGLHLPNIECAAAFNALLLEWLAQQR